MLKHTISFQNAFRGIWTAVSTQANIRIHVIVGSIVIFLGVYFHIDVDHTLDLLIAISLVMLAEMVNTAIEFLSDAVTLEHNEFIKHAKDVSAGAVLISAIFAAIIGMVIFIPKFL